MPGKIIFKYTKLSKTTRIHSVVVSWVTNFYELYFIVAEFCVTLVSQRINNNNNFFNLSSISQFPVKIKYSYNFA